MQTDGQTDRQTGKGCGWGGGGGEKTKREEENNRGVWEERGGGGEWGRGTGKGQRE